jgi:hypothetical protein
VEAWGEMRLLIDTSVFLEQSWHPYWDSQALLAA